MENKWFEIPLSQGNQSFRIQLGETEYTLKFVWRQNDNFGQWFMDILTSDGFPIMLGRPLIPEVNLLKGFEFLEIGEMVVMLDGHEDRLPKYEELGTKAKLYWSPYERNA